MSNSNSIKEFDALCLEGGGSRGIAFCGAIKVLEGYGITKNIYKYIGSSAGSIVAGLLSIGYTSEEATEILNSTDFNKFKDNYLLPFDIYRFWSKYGYYRGDYFFDWYGNKIAEKMEKKNEYLKSQNLPLLTCDLTFRELYDHFGKILVVTGSCVNEVKTYYFNYQSNPNMPIRLAVRISMSIPGLFVPITWKNKKTGKVSFLVDGGLFNNYPIYYFDANDGSLPNSKKTDVKYSKQLHNSQDSKTLGLKLISSDEFTDSQLYHGYQETGNVKEYFTAILEGMMYQIDRLHIKDNYWQRTIPIETWDISGLNFDLSSEDKQKLFDSGVNATRTYLAKQAEIKQN